MSQSPLRVVVIGGANMDIKCRIAGATVMATSNPGNQQATRGGVARNIAEALARLGIATALISAVGRDPFGERLLAETAAEGVDTSGMGRFDLPTGTYTATLDKHGELVVAVAAMGILDSLTPRWLARSRAA